MYYNLYIPVYALIIAIFLNIVFDTKKKISTKENKIFSTMLKANLFDLIISTSIVFWGYIGNYSMFAIKLLNKIDFISYIVWLSAFFIYYYNLLKRKKDISKLLIIVDVIAVILIFVAKINPYNENGIMYVVGPSTNVLYSFSILYILGSIICLCFQFKDISKKHIPFFVLVLVLILALFIRKVDPSLLVIPAMLTIVNLIMYFTIENPDLYLVQELLRNNEIVQNSLEENSKFLFKMSQDIKVPVKDILEYINIYRVEKSKKMKDESVERIEKSTKDISYLVNDALDISDMDIKNIKIYNKSYDTTNFFLDIQKKSESLINANEIGFSMNISKSIPKVLYGDSIKLKQVMMAIISNSIKYTKKGYIEVDVSAINRYDVCRLIITITDTGTGININKINEILSDNTEMTLEEEKMLDGLNINLKIVRKVLNLLGGSFNIRSEVGKGTVVLLYLDQKAEFKENKILTKNSKEYNEQMDKRNRVLLVDDKETEINLIRNSLQKHGIIVNVSRFGNDLINRINTGEKYKAIIIKDEMDNEEAFPMLINLKKIKNFNTPVIVLLNKNKLFMKEHYINDGFKDYILKENIKTDIERIINKYL